ncbi:DUF4221 family protein [Roseivirga echinicomitans]|uniref:DUF4221 domain-containing protein n=1 Tax=Roseivirga echinicomitans TaxID=296218 RepID=A0A150XDE5_9BACT|nr:DUF4221 family protein [Roseivirga echinicomitans]KYG76710.1 hypothetical protein AWN68_06700 [Roseivirga echinicomitans]
MRIDSVSSNYNQLYQAFYDENKKQELLYVMNVFTNGVDTYNLDSLVLEKRTSFDINGPEALPRIGAFHVFKKDSLLVMSAQRVDGLIVSDSSTISLGKVLGSKKIFFNHHTSSMTPILEYKQKLFVYGLPIGGDAPDSTNYLELDLVLDFEKRTIQKLYNEDMEPVDKRWGYLRYHTRTIDDMGRIIYSFPFTSELLIYDIELDSFYTQDVPSQLIETPAKMLPSGENETKHFLENNHFDGILFDKYKGLYYRFIKLSINPMDNNGRLKNAFHQETAVQVIDKAFNVVTEFKLTPVWQYLSKDSFVSKSGLFISEANNLNGNISEDSLYFTVFNFDQQKIK